MNLSKTAWAPLLALALCLVPPPARAASKPKEFHGVGVVDAVKNHGKVLVIEHEDIPGLMEAMTMAFEVADVRLSKGVHAGDRIRFTLEKLDHRYPIIAIERIKAAAKKPGNAPAPAPAPTDAMGGMKM